MDLQLENKKALVTGSTAGIGLAIATGLVREGAKVIINGRSNERVAAATDKIQESYPDAKITGVTADFSNVEEVTILTEKVAEVDILINNVGIFEPCRFEDISDNDWYRLFDVNVMSGIRLSRHFFPKMIANDWGRIIFMSSESAVQIPEEMIHYGMTKTAQLAVAGGLARLTKGTNVTVNAVVPGPTRSEGAGNFIADLARSNDTSEAQIEKDFFENVRPSSLIQRFATTDEVANLVVYLCSPLASATNGASVRVDGGAVPTIL